MPLSAYRLAEALASRLNAIIPTPIHILVERASSPALARDADVVIHVANADEPWSSQAFSNLDLQPHHEGSLGDTACDMAVAMLGGVQDGVIRILRDPWPRLPTGNVALPDGHADSERVYLWFGASQDRAVLTLRPIEIGEVFP
jgi:hypothetical protein